MPVVSLDADFVREGIRHSLHDQITYRDAALIAAAARLDALTLYTEDLDHGQLYGSVRVINPYL